MILKSGTKSNSSTRRPPKKMMVKLFDEGKLACVDEHGLDKVNVSRSKSLTARSGGKLVIDVASPAPSGRAASSRARQAVRHPRYRTLPGEYKTRQLLNATTTRTRDIRRPQR